MNIVLYKFFVCILSEPFSFLYNISRNASELRAWTLAQDCLSSVILAKFFNLFVPQYSHLLYGDNEKVFLLDKAVVRIK